MNKKTFYLILMIIPIIISCSNMMNPMYLYYNRTKSSYNNTNDVTTPDAVDADKDPFIQGEHNNIGYGGCDGKIFDTWLFKVSFQSDKLPIYNFFKDNRSWSYNGTDWKNNSANYYKPENGENKVYGAPFVGTVDIKNLTVYKYDKYNPLYDSKGYLSGRMDRFRFYSINGEAVIPLKQYLIAVDTYSKFVFAYGAITATSSTFGNKYPTEFEAIEFHAKKIHFYEYDPIGYVTENGDVIFYQHYKTEFVANPTGYTPKQHGYTRVASHNSQGHGYSPYRPITDNVEAPDNEKEEFKNKLSTLKNKEFKWRDYSGYINTGTGQMNLEEWKNAKHSGKSLELYTYKLTDDTIELVKTKYRTDQKHIEVYKLKNITSKTTAIYEYNGKKINIDIEKDNSITINAIEIGTVDYGPIFVDRVRGATFQSGGNTYTFNEDGTEFTLKYGRSTYKYTLGRFDNNLSINYSAIYKASPGGFWGNYGRVVLRKYNGKDDDLIKTSTTLGQIWGLGTADSEAGLGYNAHRVK